SRHIGSVICGQVTMWNVDELFVKEVADKTRGLGIDPTALRRAVFELEHEKAGQAMDLPPTRCRLHRRSPISVCG
ncbi:MAG: PocR ligand-binding domain-containing protein, partial [Bacillota bacterium]|nr:PocR ligand-binding domain-containing protein [Bacillota bacterium]